MSAHAGRLAALAELVEKAVGDELQPLLDELVVDLALSLDLLGRLELRREAGLELAEADVVESRGVDVIPGDPPVGLLTELDRAIDRPVGVLRVVDRHKDFPVHASASGKGIGGNVAASMRRSTRERMLAPAHPGICRGEYAERGEGCQAVSAGADIAKRGGVARCDHRPLQGVKP